MDLLLKSEIENAIGLVDDEDLQLIAGEGAVLVHVL